MTHAKVFVPKKKHTDKMVVRKLKKDEEKEKDKESDKKDSLKVAEKKVMTANNNQWILFTIC